MKNYIKKSFSNLKKEVANYQTFKNRSMIDYYLKIIELAAEKHSLKDGVVGKVLRLAMDKSCSMRELINSISYLENIFNNANANKSMILHN